jgi:hypothetical protein
MSDAIDIPLNSRERPPYPVPEAGIYGPGLQVEARVTLESIEESEFNHHFDKEGEFAPYWQFSFKIIPAEGPIYWVRELCSLCPKSGSKALDYLEAAGAPGEAYEDEEGNPRRQYKLQQAAPREVGGIEVAGPRTAKTGKVYHGDILRVIGKE